MGGLACNSTQLRDAESLYMTLIPTFVYRTPAMVRAMTSGCLMRGLMLLQEQSL